MAFDIQFKLIYQGIRDVFRVRSLSYEYNLKMVPAGNYWNRKHLKWLVYLILLILANLSYLYLWREVFWVMPEILYNAFLHN